MKFSTGRFLVPACLVFLLLGSVSCDSGVGTPVKETDPHITGDKNITPLGIYEGGYLRVRSYKLVVDSIEYVIVTHGESVAIIRHSNLNK